MEVLNPLSRVFWIPIGLSILCGAIIGVERQIRGKPAGVRTSILICLSTQLFVHLGAALGTESTDPTRVIGQIVTGVGFLGAGVILAREGSVTGVTTAAVIWILAAIGATIGLGQFAAALALSIVTVTVLTGVEMLELSFRWLRHGVHARAEHAESPDESGIKRP